MGNLAYWLFGVNGWARHAKAMNCRSLFIQRPASEDFPMVNETASNPGRIQAFLPYRNGIIEKGLGALESVQVMTYLNGLTLSGIQG